MAKKRVAFASEEFSDDSKREAIERRKAPKKESKYTRASYDILPEVKAAVKRRANNIGISQSQLAMFLLSDAMRRLDNGDIDPTPYLIDSTSPAYRHNLDQDADWVFKE